MILASEREKSRARAGTLAYGARGASLTSKQREDRVVVIYGIRSNDHMAFLRRLLREL